jgi:DNA-directed RNA polymerase specialized sigma subunit
MTSKDYLRQAYRLDQRINSDIAEAARLREMSVSVSSPAFDERVQTSRDADAPFVRCLEKIMALEEHINREIDLYVDLKEQIRTVIETVPNMDERMVLKYRYVHNMTWEQIADKLYESVSTIKRQHGSGLTHVKMPETPVVIGKLDCSDPF